jgi:hypothetical protein
LLLLSRGKKESKSDRSLKEWARRRGEVEILGVQIRKPACLQPGGEPGLVNFPPVE